MFTAVVLHIALISDKAGLNHEPRYVHPNSELLRMCYNLMCRIVCPSYFDTMISVGICDYNLLLRTYCILRMAIGLHNNFFCPGLTYVFKHICLCV